jgi:16S rRNA processing protein RimM
LIGFQPIYKNEIQTDFTLIEFIDNPAHPILLFKNSEAEILIPYINQFVGKVDIENKTIEILNWEDWFVED